MKRTIFIISSLIALSAAANEAVPADTATVDTVQVIEGAHRMVLTENAQGVTVTVTGKDDNPDYTFTYRSHFSPDAKVTTSQESNNWQLTLPFSRRAKKMMKYPSNDITVGGLAFGGVFAPGGGNLMKTNKGKSWEIMLLNAVAYQRRFTPNDRLSAGIGIDWKNYRLDDNLRYYKADDGAMTIDTYGEAVSEQSSRIKTFSWLVPVIYERRIYDDFWIHAGAVLNFNTYASVKTKYRIADLKYEHFDDNIRQNVVTCDVMAAIRYSWLGFYVKYSPCNVLKSSTGLKFQSLTAGIILGF